MTQTLCSLGMDSTKSYLKCLCTLATIIYLFIFGEVGLSLLPIKGCKSEKNQVTLSMFACVRFRILREICLFPILVFSVRNKMLDHFSQKQAAMHTVGKQLV